MADTKLTSLPLGGAVTGQDILYLVQNPGTTPTSVKVTVANFLQMVAGGSAPHAVTHRPGGPDVLVNNAWTDQANVFTQGQTIQQAAGPQLKIIDTGQVVDSRMWRIQNIGTQLNFLASNDAVTVNASVFALHRDGRLVMPDTTTGYIQFGTTGVGAPTAGTRSVGTKLVLYPRATTPGEADYALGIEGGSLWYSTPILSGVHRWYGGTTQQMTLSNNNLTVVGSITGGALSCTSINTNGNGITCGPISASGRQTITGGSATAYNTAPLEIMLASYPRVGFHWPGVVASQIGMDSAGTIRTLDSTGTGYVAFACAGLTCHAINTQGSNLTTGAGNVTCGTLNVSGQTWVGAIHSYGAANSNSISTANITVSSDVTTSTLTVTSAARIGGMRIHGDDATNYGYPWIRAAAGAHMCINATPLYLNLDLPGQQVLVYGPLNCQYTVSIPNGDSVTPALRFNSYPNSGIYVATQNPTVEFGANFNAAHRALFRAYLNQAIAEIYCGVSVVMQFAETQTIIKGNFYPTANSTYQCGVGSIAWGWVHSVNFIQTSDIRRKDVHGLVPDSLDLLDEIDPLIASFKEGFRPRKREDAEGEFYKFPTFSAQQIAEKLDAKYGTRVVEHDEESDSWGIDYGKLVPVLWQMLRQLKARVEALES